jgi:hypothetical protein
MKKTSGGLLTIEFVGIPGTITCSSSQFAGLTGTLQTNNLPTDTVQMESAFGILNGSGPECHGTSDLGKTAVVHLRPHGAILSLAGIEGTAELAAASEPIVLEVANSGDEVCVFSAQKLAGVLKLEAAGSPFQAKGYRQINIQLEHQSMEFSAGSGPGCPLEVTVNASLGWQGQLSGETSAAFIFGRFPLPTIAKLTPSKGPVSGGTTVTITGAHFTEVSAVTFGSVPAASYTVDSTTSITAISPPEAASKVGVTVTGPGGTSISKPYKFTPVVSSLTPNSGPAAGDTSVSVSGEGFVPGATTFKFGTTLAQSVECTSSTFCTVVSPAHAAGKLYVTAAVNSIVSANGAQNRYTYF